MGAERDPRPEREPPALHYTRPYHIRLPLDISFG